MTIHIDSWQAVFGAILAAAAVFSLVATLHWKVFAEPRLRKILAPYGERLDVVTNVVRLKFPQEYREALGAMQDERPLRSVI